MPPEQFQGLSECTERSDLYSLGLLLYEMLTGRSPYEADGAEGYLMSHMAEEPIPLREVDPWTAFLPAGLHQLLDSLLEKNPSQRPKDAAAVAVTLGALHEELDEF